MITKKQLGQVQSEALNWNLNLNMLKLWHRFQRVHKCNQSSAAGPSKRGPRPSTQTFYESQHQKTWRITLWACHNPEENRSLEPETAPGPMPTSNKRGSGECFQWCFSISTLMETVDRGRVLFCIFQYFMWPDNLNGSYLWDAGNV